MTIQKQYCNALEKQLGRHAVWQPGNPLALGDYGTLSGGLFLKLGNIADFKKVEAISTVVGKPSKLVFTSNGTTTALIKADTTVGQGPANIAEARFRIKFQDEYSIYLRGSGVRNEEIANLHAVTEQLRKVKGWKTHWKVVSSVTSAKLLSIILAGGKNAEVSVHASTAVLEMLDSGEAAASTKIQISGQSGYSAVGVSGPLLFDLIKLRPILGGIKKGATPGALVPFEKVPARP